MTTTNTTYRPVVRTLPADPRPARPMSAGLAAIVKASREGADFVGEWHERFMPKG